MTLYFFLFSLCFYTLGLNMFKESIFLLIEWEMFSLNSLSVIFPLILDFKCLMFLGTVFLISSMVLLYSNCYMEGEINSSRFIYLLILFVLSMMFLIVSPCMVSILLGWDGLGLTSYCLVIFYQNQKSSNSGMITALTNRVGDVLILLSIGLMSSFGSWNFQFMYFYESDLKELIYVLVGFAAMTKSAQIPFSAWLPAAMAAPTPVSSLVHSSTLVTAGVYLLIRFSPLILESSMMVFFLSLVGSSTMVMSGLSANFQFDLKKIIALSTLSQLGVMFTSLSLGMVDYCFFHLLTHAMFKSLLFMCAGSFIHSNLNNQDIRLFGDTNKFFPLTLVYFNTANLALCGMPFLSGFYSKDLILEALCLSSSNWLVFFFFFFATGLTVCYTIRLIFMTMNFKFNYLGKLVMLKDNSFEMNLSMFTMFICSMYMGKFGSVLFLESPSNYIVLPLSLKILTIIVCLLGGWVGYLVSGNMLPKMIFNFSIFSEWLNSMWFLSCTSPVFLKKWSLVLSSKSCKLVSYGWVEETMGERAILMMKKLSLDLNNWFLSNDIFLTLLSFFFSLNIIIISIFW